MVVVMLLQKRSLSVREKSLKGLEKNFDFLSRENCISMGILHKMSSFVNVFSQKSLQREEVFKEFLRPFFEGWFIQVSVSVKKYRINHREDLERACFVKRTKRKRV